MTDAAPSTALTTEARPRPTMTVGGNVGALIPQDIEQAFRIASALAHSGMAPNGFQTPEKCFVAIMAGAELGLPPFQSLQSFAIINGRPTIYGAALMAVIRTNGFKVREWFEGEGETLTAFCEVTRPDDGDKAEASYSVADAKTAKLWGKAGPWTTNPKRMLQWRARGFSFTDGAADVLKGLQIREVVQDDEPFTEEPKAREGTGLLGKLEATQTLATEGFGIRDVGTEAGGASPEAEPKPVKKRTRKAEADEALMTAGDEIVAEAAAREALAAIAKAEPDVVETVTADHADAAEDAVFEADAGTHDAFPGDTGANPEKTPADGQVEETAATDAPTVDDLSSDAAQAIPLNIISGPAPADTVYFLAEAEAFPSGRRAVWFNGLPNGVEDASEPHPTYTEHAPAKAEAPEAAAFDDAPGELATEAKAATPHDVFHEATIAATTADELVAALKALFASGEVPNPDAKRIPRIRVWSQARALNEDGAKIAPESDPYILSCYIEAETDPEAVQAMLPLASDQDWFKAGGEAMQTGVSRAIMDRVSALTGGA